MKIPSMRLYGKENVQIISHKGLGTCSEKSIEIYTNAGIMCINGKSLEISVINNEYISIRGVIEQIFYKD